MSWSLARMARYVRHTKYYQQIKEKDDVCNQAFEKASYLLFSRERPLLTSSASASSNFIATPVWVNYADTKVMCEDLKSTSVILGIEEKNDDDTPLFACRVKSEEAENIGEKYNGRFTDMRMAIFTLPPNESRLVCRAFSLLKWNDTMKFCPKCASPLKRNLSGTSRSCEKNCDPKNLHFYPQLNPVAITRVTDPTGEKALLVRQPRHPKGMYSCIAGFIESGETLEDSVRREIAEEAGIVVGKIDYFQSQTWPLPQDSLMLGCTATAMEGSETLDIDKGELEDARWFSKAEVKEALRRVTENVGILRNNEDNVLLVPPAGAVAHHLLQNWISGAMPSNL